LLYSEPRFVRLGVEEETPRNAQKFVAFFSHHPEKKEPQPPKVPSPNKSQKTISKVTLFIPSRELTYPTLGKGKSSSKCHFWGICLFPGGYSLQKFHNAPPRKLPSPTVFPSVFPSVTYFMGWAVKLHIV